MLQRATHSSTQINVVSALCCISQGFLENWLSAGNKRTAFVVFVLLMHSLLTNRELDRSMSPTIQIDYESSYYDVCARCLQAMHPQHIYNSTDPASQRRGSGQPSATHKQKRKSQARQRQGSFIANNVQNRGRLCSQDMCVWHFPTLEICFGLYFLLSRHTCLIQHWAWLVNKRVSSTWDVGADRRSVAVVRRRVAELKNKSAKGSNNYRNNDERRRAVRASYFSGCSIHLR